MTENGRAEKAIRELFENVTGPDAGTPLQPAAWEDARPSVEAVLTGRRGPHEG